jgi:hypothetical protein
MKAFLRENWPYIVTPIAVVLIVLVVVLVLGEDGPGRFIYNL